MLISSPSHNRTTLPPVDPTWRARRPEIALRIESLSVLVFLGAALGLAQEGVHGSIIAYILAECENVRLGSCC